MSSEAPPTKQPVPPRAVHIMAALAFAYVFLLSLLPLSDPDVWWHLKTGQVLIEQHRIPGIKDEFAFTTPYPMSDVEMWGMRGQLIGQGILYLAFKFFGYAGVSALRSLMIVGPFAAMYAYFIRKGVAPLLAFFAMIFPAFAIAIGFPYSYERPQAFSFALLPVVYVLLERSREGGRWAPIFLPAVIAAWGFTHGGVLVGVMVAGAYAGGTLVAQAATKFNLALFGAGPRRPLVFWASIAATLALAASNPNIGYQLQGWYERLKLLMRGIAASAASEALVSSERSTAAASPVLLEVLEYKPLMFFYRDMHIPWPLYMAAFIVLGLALVVGAFIVRRRVDLQMAASASLVAALGFYYVKGTNFALVFIAYAICASVGLHGGRRLRLASTLLLCALSVAIVTKAAISMPWQLKPSAPASWVSPIYPERALRFIDENRIEGPIFNNMLWGGYIIWREGPAMQVFLDGRSISDQATMLYLEVMKGQPQWRSILEAYKVNMLLVPLVSKETGVVFPIVMQLALSDSKDWSPVYLNGNVVILLKNTPKNKALIDYYGFGYGRVFEEVLAHTELMSIDRPDSNTLKLNRGVALYGLGRYAEAREALAPIADKIPLAAELVKKASEGR